MGKELTYSVLDVFAERGLEGNPLAVFHDGRGLSDAEMQAIARETNLSETTFVLPGETAAEREEGVRVRIFTTQEELPFAGHPTLGTATWLYLNHPTLRGAESITLKLNVGPIAVQFTPPAEAEHGVMATMQQNDAVFGPTYDAAEIAAVIGVVVDDLLPGFAPQTVSTGNPFCVVALRSVEALSRLAIPQREATAWLKARGIRWFYCIAPAEAIVAGRCVLWRARMQWYAGEDPATGSAAGPCIAWLVKHGLVASAEAATIDQGVEMLRPSRITVHASGQGETIGEIGVAGRTIPVAEGRLFLP
jgi:trans-2,3-dihydro-3-hydroxyanthranilate isomerase